MPFLIAGIMTDKAFLNIFMGILSLFSFYEIGYVWNDNPPSKKELFHTKRQYVKKFNVKFFTILRIILSSIILYITVKINGADYEFIYIFAFLILFIFYFHNNIVNINWRLFTFILLNTFKVLFILKICSISILILAGFLPYFFIKTFNYIRVKKIISATPQQENNLFLPIFSASFFISMFFSLPAALIILNYALIYNRSHVKNFLHSFIQKFKFINSI
jgi:hypothetical protein